MKQRVEQYFKELHQAIDKEIEAFTVEWRQYEALTQIQLKEDLYVFIIFSWSDEEDCTIEYMIGDENAVIQTRHLDKLDLAVSIIKTAHQMAKEKLACLQRS